MQISGYMFPVELNPELNAVFLPFTTSWGWATWQRAWKQYDPLMSGYSLLKQDRKLRKLFNLDGSYPYFEILESQIKGKIDSWTIRWYLSSFMLNGMTLHPFRSLVQNRGFDGSGTHCRSNKSRLEQEIASDGKISNFPDPGVLDLEATNSIFRYLKNHKKNFYIKILGSSGLTMRG